MRPTMARTTPVITREIRESICDLARTCGISRVIVFGSRARGDNHERSDIDLAIEGGDTAAFSCDVDYEVPTLLMFDVVDLERPVSPDLLASIEREGIEIYHKPATDGTA